MDIRFQAGGPKLWKASIMLVFAHKGEDPATLCPEIETCSPWFTIAPGRKDFAANTGDLALFHGHPEQDIPRILALGLGEREKFTLHTLRKAMASALARCREIGAESVLIPVPALAALGGASTRLVEESIFAAFAGLYRFTELRTKPEEKTDPLWLALGFSEEHVPDAEHAAARRGEHAAAGVILARKLANMPPNIMTPLALAESAQKMCATEGMACTVLKEQELSDLGCNTLLAVGAGSCQETCMVIMEHAPKGHEEEDPIILVGKGLTFDSGGISLKPATNMHHMKSDMSGAAAVVGAMQGISQNMLEKRVIGIIACAENMPGGSAMRPGDVVTSLSGKTVEILNTDAEGRLALCDALTYAQKQYKPAYMVDIATLTGACSVALGKEVAGLFTDDEALRDEIMATGTLVGDNFWPLPLWDSYAESLKSDVADIAHMGGREGGAITAALYLKAFIEDGTRWAHLDIAGTDWAFTKTPLSPVGAIGFGVRTLIELVRGTV